MTVFIPNWYAKTCRNKNKISFGGQSQKGQKSAVVQAGFAVLLSL